MARYGYNNPAAPAGSKFAPASKKKGWDAMTDQQRKVLVAKYVTDPSLRTKIPTRYLPTKYREQRISNRTSITPGSSITGGELSKRADAAATLQYGGAMADTKKAATTAAGVARDTQGWYDQYMQELERARQNTVGANQAADNTIKGLQGSITGLSQPSAQNAAANGGSAQNQTDASNAAAIRQALGASLGGRQAGLGASANNYANQLAHVVAPGQKLQAAAVGAQQVKDANQKVTDLKAQIGAYKQNYRSQVTDAENKNILAQAIAQNKTTADITKEKIKAGAKVSVDGSKINKYGVTNSEWSGWSHAHQLAWIKKLHDAGTTPKSSKGSGSGGSGKSRDKTHPGGAGYLTTSQQNNYWKQVESARALLRNGWTADGVISSGKADLTQVRIANRLNLTNGGSISSRDANALHKAGVLLHNRYKISNKPVKPRPISGGGKAKTN